jgi:phosphohistidine phosphatase
VPRDGINLHLLRHADAGDALRWPGPDSTRPLSAAGVEQAERLAGHLRMVGFTCDAVLTSPKVRARQTAQALADAFGLSVILDERLADELSVDRVDHLLTDHGNPRTPVLVGHDPDFSELLTSLIGAVDLSMKKGAFARLEVRRPLTAGTATLRWLLPPDALRHR